MSFTSDKPIQVNQLPISIDFPKDQDKFMEAVTLFAKRVVNTLNTKEGGLFSLQELFDSQQYFISGNPNQFRNVYRKVFDIIALNGAPLAPGATFSQPHSIQGFSILTHLYGGATNSDNPPKFIPMPYNSATTLTNQTESYVTSQNIVVINGATQTALTQCYIVVEFLKT